MEVQNGGCRNVSPCKVTLVASLIRISHYFRMLIMPPTKRETRFARATGLALLIQYEHSKKQAMVGAILGWRKTPHCTGNGSEPGPGVATDRSGQFHVFFQVGESLQIRLN